MTDAWVDDWLGEARFHRYVAQCSGDRQLALDLYEWNVTLGQCLLRDISHFEIALRNAYDKAISSTWLGELHWLLDPDSPAVAPIWRVKENERGYKRGVDVNYKNRQAVDRAIQECGGAKATPGKVMAELTFGFWTRLSAASHEKGIWVPHLHHAYPKGTRRRSVHRVVSTINTVRNRIAHHEPIFDRIKVPVQDPDRLHSDLVSVLKLIAPEVAAHISKTSRVESVLRQRPKVR